MEKLSLYKHFTCLNLYSNCNITKSCKIKYCKICILKLNCIVIHMWVLGAVLFILRQLNILEICRILWLKTGVFFFLYIHIVSIALIIVCKFKKIRYWPSSHLLCAVSSIGITAWLTQNINLHWDLCVAKILLTSLNCNCYFTNTCQSTLFQVIFHIENFKWIFSYLPE